MQPTLSKEASSLIQGDIRVLFCIDHRFFSLEISYLYKRITPSSVINVIEQKKRQKQGYIEQWVQKGKEITNKKKKKIESQKERNDYICSLGIGSLGRGNKRNAQNETMC